MSAQAQTQQQSSEEKLFFYYPGYNEQFPRRVLAGLLDGNTIHVSEAVCFPGTGARIIPVKLMAGNHIYIADPGIPADIFVKKDGKRIAIDRARGWKDLPTKDPNVTKRVWPGQQLIAEITISGDKVKTTFLGDALAAPITKTITDLPPDGLSVGKAFVEGIDAYLKHYGFPEKPKKVKKNLVPGATGTNPAPDAR